MCHSYGKKEYRNNRIFYLHAKKSNLVFWYLSLTDTQLREWNIFSLSAVHPYSNCLSVLLPSSASV